MRLFLERDSLVDQSEVMLFHFYPIEIQMREVRYREAVSTRHQISQLLGDDDDDDDRVISTLKPCAIPTLVEGVFREWELDCY